MAWAKALDHGDVADLLSTSLDEEKAADEKLSELAEAGLNEAALSGEEADDLAESEEDVAGNSRLRPVMAGAGASSRSGRGRSAKGKRSGR